MLQEAVLVADSLAQDAGPPPAEAAGWTCACSDALHATFVGRTLFGDDGSAWCRCSTR